MTHISVCTERNGKREAFILSAETEDKAVRWAETFSGRIGYVGNTDFQEAVRRCVAMENNTPGAWGKV